MKLILAQGNPEKKYDNTRHNVGFFVLDQFASYHQAVWIDKSKFHAKIAELTIHGEKVILVKPVTYYNETGLSARNIIDFYNLDPATDLLVIHDDLALPFGTIRTRAQGSDAGNNGIKSINNHIGQAYHRIRIGVWNELRDRMDDATFVLSKFSKDEAVKLASDTIPHVATLLEKFAQGILEIDSTKI